MNLIVLIVIALDIPPFIEDVLNYRN